MNIIKAIKNAVFPKKRFVQFPAVKTGVVSTQKFVHDLRVFPVVGEVTLPEAVEMALGRGESVDTLIGFDFTREYGFTPKNLLIADDGILCVLAEYTGVDPIGRHLAPANTTMKIMQHDGRQFAYLSI